MKHLEKINNLPKKIVFWGGSHHARTVEPIIKKLGSEVAVIIDDTPELKSVFESVEIYQGIDGLNKWMIGKDPKDYGFVIAIANPHSRARCKLHNTMEDLGFKSVTFADPSAQIDKRASIGSSVQIMNNVIIQPGVKIHDNCIIGIGAIVEHDVVLNEGVELGPGTVLAGRVEVGRHSWVGTGAIAFSHERGEPTIIGENTMIGAGTVVNKNVPSNVVAIGNPVRVLKKNS